MYHVERFHTILNTSVYEQRRLSLFCFTDEKQIFHIKGPGISFIVTVATNALHPSPGRYIT